MKHQYKHPYYEWRRQHMSREERRLRREMWKWIGAMFATALICIAFSVSFLHAVAACAW